MAIENYCLFVFATSSQKLQKLLALVLDWTHTINLYPFKMKSWKTVLLFHEKLNYLGISELVSAYDEITSHGQ